MGEEQYSQQVAPVATCIPPPPPPLTTAPQPAPTPLTSPIFYPLLILNLILSLLSIANLGLISSAVAWQLAQKQNVHNYRVNWPATTFDLNVEPANLWVDQVYINLAAAAYGVMLGLFGLFVAWRIRKSTRPLKSVTTLLLLHLLGTIFTFSALVLVFVVTYRTTNQLIRAPIAANTQGFDYDEFTWTPETWLTAVLDLPLADERMHDEIISRVTAMVAWRWMLVPIFVVDIIACGVTTLAWLKQRKGATTRADLANTIEK